jgi:hypothetical protein
MNKFSMFLLKLLISLFTVIGCTMFMISLMIIYLVTLPFTLYWLCSDAMRNIWTN